MTVYFLSTLVYLRFWALKKPACLTLLQFLANEDKKNTRLIFRAKYLRYYNAFLQFRLD